MRVGIAVAWVGFATAVVGNGLIAASNVMDDDNTPISCVEELDRLADFIEGNPERAELILIEDENGTYVVDLGENAGRCGLRNPDVIDTLTDDPAANETTSTTAS